MCRQQIPPNSAPPPPPAASFDPWSDGARLYQPIHTCQPTMATQPMLQELISLSTQGNKSAPVVYFLASLSFLIGDLPTWMLLMCVISFPLVFFSFICFHPLFYPDIRTLGLNALASSLAPSPPTYLPWLGKLFVKLTLFFLLFFFSASLEKKRKVSPPQTCVKCHTTETPEWRNGPAGPGTLCNVCGLVFAKKRARRDRDSWSLDVNNARGGC